MGPARHPRHWNCCIHSSAGSKPAGRWVKPGAGIHQKPHLRGRPRRRTPKATVPGDSSPYQMSRHVVGKRIAKDIMHESLEPCPCSPSLERAELARTGSGPSLHGLVSAPRLYSLTTQPTPVPPLRVPGDRAPGSPTRQSTPNLGLELFERIRRAIGLGGFWTPEVFSQCPTLPDQEDHRQHNETENGR